MKEVFQITPAGGGPLWFLLIVAAILLGLTVFLALVAISSRSSIVELSAHGLSIRSTFYGRTIPWSLVVPEAAATVDLTRQTELAPSLRTNGIGLPGYGAGWFRLHNGQKALAFVTDRSRVAYIPTRGFALLVSVRDPEALVISVKRRAANSAR